MGKRVGQNMEWGEALEMERRRNWARRNGHIREAQPEEKWEISKNHKGWGNFPQPGFKPMPL